MTRILHNDFESRGVIDLKRVGTHNYVKHPLTKILMWAWAIDNGPVHLWEPHLGPMPEEALDALRDPSVSKAAWHANFERSLFAEKLDIIIPIEQWIDPMVNARYFSLPGSLEKVGEVLNIPVNLRKSAEGEDLIKLFCVPRPQKKLRRPATNENTLFDISPTEETSPTYVFADHTTHPEEWKSFGGYCRQDVVAERAIGERLEHKSCAPLPEREKKLWFLDQHINAFGMPADRKFVENSYTLALRNKNELFEEQKKLTGLENPNSSTQMLKWARERGYPRNSLKKESVIAVLNDTGNEVTDECRKVLELRKLSGKTSYTKLAALSLALSDDDYLRDQFLFMGSARAGRWSGRQVQLHNMARPIKALEVEGALDLARQLILAADYDGLKKKFGSVIDVVTSCIRSAFVAPPGMRFNVCDLNAIENRVLGWMTGEEKILDVFRTLSSSGRKRCPYLTFACVMYNIPYDVLERAYYEKKDPDAKEKRQVAKPAVLGCGYRLSGGEWKENRYGDLVKTGLWGYAENMGISISQELAQESVKQFRAEYHKVVQAWYEYEDAVLRCLSGQGPQEMCSNGPKDETYGCQLLGRAHHHLIWCDRRVRKDGSFVLRIHLPSGRSLHYVDAQIVEKEFPSRDGGTYKKKSMAYMGINQENKMWDLIYTHGGKFVENVDQAIARDVLAEGMLECNDIGLQVCGHIHDELITLSEDSDEAPGLSDLKAIMSRTPVWAPGLPLDADGYQDSYYHK